MQERVRELENEIINKTKEKVDSKREFTDTTCQTEDHFHEVSTKPLIQLRSRSTLFKNAGLSSTL